MTINNDTAFNEPGLGQILNLCLQKIPGHIFSMNRAALFILPRLQTECKVMLQTNSATVANSRH